MSATTTRRAAAVVLATLLLAPPTLAASAAPVRGERAMAVTPDAAASRVAMETIDRGGNAVDAAVAAAFVLAVTYPIAGSLGGGGFMLLRDAEGRHHALDFRETAPAELRPELFLDEEGRPVPDRSLRSGLAVGVPGNVAGLAEAHRRFGALPWREVVRPAERLARSGFEVSPFLARAIAASVPALRNDPRLAHTFLPGGRPLAAGTRLVQPGLAETLHAVAADGPRAVYRGAVAEAIAAAAQARGGVLTTADLAGYEPTWREPLVGHYRGHRVVTFPPPSSGGVTLLQILGMLERFDLATSGAGSSLTIHRLTEAERRAFADRAVWLGDPDAVDVPVARLLAPDYLAARSATIDDDRAARSADVGPWAPASAADGGGETLHLSVAGPAGDAVALTATINGWFGAGILAGDTGIVLNNEMDDFALAPGTPNQWGLVGAEANAVAGGKRPLSSMTPTIVERGASAGRPVLVLGSPGGGSIITNVLQVLVNVLDHGMDVQEAVDAPRTHHQWLPDALRHERLGIPADVLDALARRGHALEPVEALGNVNAIGLGPDGAWLGAADPRREGVAVSR